MSAIFNAEKRLFFRSSQIRFTFGYILESWFLKSGAQLVFSSIFSVIANSRIQFLKSMCWRRVSLQIPRLDITFLPPRRKQN
jgi:hypothetical protein